jgi:predicted secreted protein
MRSINLKFLFLFLISIILIFSQIKESEAEQKQTFQFSKDQQIQQMKPKKPVRIKLHRNAKGEYSWDITGDNVDEVVSADKRLRKLLKID